MAFLYSVIGDNTPQNREWLEKVGYELVVNSELDKYICVFHDFSYAIGGNFIPDYFYHKAISLIENHQLFRAVTAMRDDSDYMQLFKCDGGYFISSYNDANTHIQDYCKGWDMTNLKKMTLSELKEHFQRVQESNIFYTYQINMYKF